MPSAELLGGIELRHYRLAFHKKSKDGSSKCNLVRTDNEFDQVYGAIYKLDSKHKNDLDSFEGKGYGYIDQQVMLQHQGQQYNCFTYFAQQSFIENDLKPYHWYKDLVVLGAKHLQFPNAYVRSLELIESVEDPDEVRRKCHEQLLERMIDFG